MNQKFTLLLVISILFNACLIAQVQFGSDIDGDAPFYFSGNTVVLSNDGSRVAVSSPFAMANLGLVKVFEFSGGSWNQLGDDILATGPGQGSILAFNDAANRLFVGDTFGNGNFGQIRVYEFDGGSWNQLGNDINGLEEGDNLGVTVSTNAAGDRVVAGTRLFEGENYARVFEFTGGSWVQLGNTIDGPIYGAQNTSASVTMSSDGNRIALGADVADGVNGDSSGIVRVFEFSGGVWSQLGATINGAATNDRFGTSVSFNSSGTILGAGAWDSNGNGGGSGEVRIFEFSGGSWSQIGNTIIGEATEDESGGSISINDAGNIIIIGAVGNDGTDTNAGHARVYRFTGGNWEQVGVDLDGEARSDFFGVSVSINGAGDRVAIGASGNDGNGEESGHVRVFDFSSLGVDNLSLSLDDIVLHSNPVREMLHIENVHKKVLIQATILDVTGRLVRSIDLRNTGLKKTVDLSSISEGYYNVVITGLDGRLTKKLIKE